jgi:hypothetical protein
MWLEAIILVLLIILISGRSKEGITGVLYGQPCRREHMATCQVDAAAIASCKSSIDAYTAAIAAAQVQAQKDAAAVDARNKAIVAWQSEHDRQLQMRDEGRQASSNQVWHNNKLYDCTKLSVGENQDAAGY